MAQVAQQVQETEEKLNWHWRNTMRVARFFSFDARAAAPLPLLLVYARLSTLILTIVTLIFFRFLEQRGLTFPSALRLFRTEVAAVFWGAERPGLVGIHRRKFKDYG